MLCFATQAIPQFNPDPLYRRVWSGCPVYSVGHSESHFPLPIYLEATTNSALTKLEKHCVDKAIPRPQHFEHLPFLTDPICHNKQVYFAIAKLISPDPQANFLFTIITNLSTVELIQFKIAIYWQR